MLRQSFKHHKDKYKKYWKYCLQAQLLKNDTKKKINKKPKFEEKELDTENNQTGGKIFP